MPNEIEIDKIQWTALEYEHKEHSSDWFWAVGLITLLAVGLTIWFKNYLFAIFIFISGASLILFSVRHPQEVPFSIETEGLVMGKYKYPWKQIKGFDIKKRNGQHKLLIELNKYFLPVYTISIPSELAPQIKNTLDELLPRVELDESKSMLLMEKMGM